MIYTVLTNGALVAFNAGGTIVWASQALNFPSDTVREAGHDLALAKDGGHVFALVPGGATVPDQILVADSRSGVVLATHALPAAGVYRSLAVGSTSGQVYVFGNRGGNLLVSEVDSEQGTMIASWTLRQDDNLDWLVYQAAITPDEQRIYISYHGIRTTGIDWFDREDGVFRACSSRARPNTGCIVSHGAFSLSEDSLLAATGDTVIMLFNQKGALERAFDTRLEGNHLMEFAIDPRKETLYAVGACGYVGGVSSLSLRDGGTLITPLTPGLWNWRTTPSPAATNSWSDVCGNRLAHGVGVLAAAKSRVAVPQMDRSGVIVVLDVVKGAPIKSFQTAAEPVDVLVSSAR